MSTKKTTSPKQRTGKTSAVQTVIKALRNDALNSEDGTMIGSEEDLLQRYEVSRPTLRQAAALVVQEQVLQVKRGVGGGYIARRPSSEATTHMAAIYLQSHQASASELIHSLEPMRTHLAMEAARNGSEAENQELKIFLNDNQDYFEDIPESYVSFVESERIFGEIIGRMSGNRVLSLFLNIIYELSGELPDFESSARQNPDAVREYQKSRNKLAQAIIDRDPEQAELFARRCSILSRRWLSGLNSPI